MRIKGVKTKFTELDQIKAANDKWLKSDPKKKVYGKNAPDLILGKKRKLSYDNANSSSGSSG